MSHEEDHIIQKYFEPLTIGDKAARGFRDDAASIIMDSDDFCVATTDMLIAGVHFFEDDTPEDIAWKALAVNVSDLIASGGRPRHYLLSIALNGQTDGDWLTRFSSGLGTAQEKFGLHLIGGDTTRNSGPLTISITALGTTPQSAYIARGGARPGDVLFVTGTIGDGYLGCALRSDPEQARKWDLNSADEKYLVERYLRPSPRLEMIPLLREFATASMDISDGLILDFERLAQASSCGGVIEAGSVPLSEAARHVLSAAPDLLPRLFTGGDDYELLIAISATKTEKFVASTVDLEVQVTNIGSFTDRPGEIDCRSDSGEVLKFDRPGYDHFDR